MTQLVGDLELPEFDYFDADMRGERFHATMRDLRAQGWLARSPLGVFVLDREAVAFFLRTRAAEFPGMEVARLFGISDGPLYEAMRRNIITIHGDDHRRLRNLVNPAFTPRAADRYRPAMRGFLEGLWADVASDGRCEFVEAFAKPYPSQVIATVMGAPVEDAPRLHEWSYWIQRSFNAATVLPERERIEQAIVEFYEYAHELLDERRATPSDDLISTLIAAEEEGDRLSPVELVNLVLNVLVGGVDTTQSQLAQAMRLFATHPEQWRALREDPELVPRAVEEVVRFEPITPFTARMTTEDVVYDGVTFPTGTLLMLSAFDANRAPAAYTAPERFDITADRGAAKVMTFGAGIHYCLGVSLARAELQEALAFLAAEVEMLELDGDPLLDGVAGIYGVDSLPLRFTAARPAPVA